MKSEDKSQYNAGYEAGLIIGRQGAEEIGYEIGYEEGSNDTRESHKSYINNLIKENEDCYIYAGDIIFCILKHYHGSKLGSSKHLVSLVLQYFTKQDKRIEKEFDIYRLFEHME